jgi:hypothetical protein
MFDCIHGVNSKIKYWRTGVEVRTDHNFSRVVIEHGGDIFFRKGVGGVTDQ